MTKINIGGFELDSTKLPKEGLDYSKFDEQTKNALSVFDTDKKKGHLSKAELQNAIAFFASQDGAKEVRNDLDGTMVKQHKKDGNIDNYEYEKTLDKYSKKTENTPQRNQIVKTAAITAKKTIAEYLETYKNEHNGKMPSDEVLKTIEEKAYNLVARSTFYEMNAKGLFDYKGFMKKSIQAISMTIAANEKGLKPTDMQNVFQDSNGKYFTYMNEQFYPANKQGTYKVYGKPNEHGQKSVVAYDRNGEIKYMKALNYQNKAYTKENFAAGVLCMNQYHPVRGEEDVEYSKDGRNFVWDNKKHAFLPK